MYKLELHLDLENNKSTWIQLQTGERVKGITILALVSLPKSSASREANFNTASVASKSFCGHVQYGFRVPPIQPDFFSFSNHNDRRCFDNVSNLVVSTHTIAAQRWKNFSE